MTQTIRHKRLKKNLGNSRTMKEAMIKSKYSVSYAESPAQVRETKGGKEVITSVLEQYQKEEQRLLDAAGKKDLTKEQYRTIIDSLDKVRKQIQLCGGGATSNIAMIIQIAPEIADKNDINKSAG